MDFINLILALSVIIVNALLILGVVAKSAKDKAEMQSSINANYKSITDMKRDYDKELDTLRDKNESTNREMIFEMKENNKLLQELNTHIIRFEERQDSQWRIISKHSRQIEDLEKNRKE